MPIGSPTFVRHPDNPVLKPDPQLDEAAVYNPGAFELDGTVFLIPRVRRASTRESHFTLAWSGGGGSFARLPYPVMFGSAPYEKPALSRPRETGGVEDCRVTLMDGRVYLAYTAYSRACHTCIAWMGQDEFTGLWLKSRLSSVDRRDEWDAAWTRLGPAFPEMTAGPDFSRNGCLFKQGGRYFLFYRRSYGGIRLAWARRPCGPWRDTGDVIGRDFPWEQDRVGICSPPALLESGDLLFLYHGVEKGPAGSDYQRTYHLGLFTARMSADRPGLELVTKAPVPVLSPAEPYELPEGGWLRTGGVRVAAVFSCGMVRMKSGFLVPYGAADHSVCAGTLHP